MKKHLLFSILLFNLRSEAQNLLVIPDTLSGVNFSLNIYDTSKVFYTGFTTNTFGVNANYLGPTLFLNQGDSVSIQVNNTLMDTTTIHWHGLHVSAMNDGSPHITIPPGTVWNPKFKVRDHAATYWYHPHLHMMTNLHATLGAAGIIIVRDTVEKKLNLPRRYGIDDFPLVIQSKCFDSNKQILIGNASDSTVMVNGTRNAYLPAPAQVVRFRMLNASSERVYNLGLQGNLSFYQIGTDGGLLNAPVPLTRLRLAPGERAEILVDFTGKAGQNIKLMSFASELPNAIYGALQPGMGPGQTIPGYSTNILNGSNFTIMTFSVTAATISPVTTVPGALMTNSPWPIASANAFKTLTFTPVNMGPTAIQGPFLINNASFNMNLTNYIIPMDNIEIWTLNNQSSIAHPFHIHDVQFYITEMNGAAPPANLSGRKDVVLVPAMQTVKFITKFETFCDSMAHYMYHCHMLPHEDDGMMGQFTVQCSATGITETSNDNSLSIFPNPSKGVFTLSTSGKISKLEIRDVLGNAVFQSEESNLTQQIDLSKQSKGVYFIEVFNKDGFQIKKLIIQ